MPLVLARLLVLFLHVCLYTMNLALDSVPLGTSQGDVTARPQQAALGAAAPTPEVQPAKAERRQLPQLPLDQQHLHNRLQSQPSPVPQQQPQQSLPDGGNDGHSGPDGNSGPGEHQRRWPTTGARHSGGADTKGTVDIQSRCPPTTAAPQPAESDAARGTTRNDTAHSESQPTPLAKCFKFSFFF